MKPTTVFSSISWSLVIGLAIGIAGCGGSSGGGGTGGDRTQFTCTPAGGTFPIEDRPVSIIVPAGAVAANTQVTVDPLTSVGTLPGGATAYTNTGIRCSSTTFTNPVTVRINYNGLGVAAADEANLRIYRRTSAGGAWAEMPTTVDTAGNTASCQTSSFSDFVLGRPVGAVGFVYFTHVNPNGGETVLESISMNGAGQMVNMNLPNGARVWTLNTQQIYYTITGGANNGAWLQPKGGGAPSELDTGDSTQITAQHSQFSPDRTKIAFTYNTTRDNYTGPVTFLSPTGGLPMPATALFNGSVVAWYPDGQHILAFGGPGPNHMMYFKVPINGSAPEQVPMFGGTIFPTDIDPFDGDILAVQHSGETETIGYVASGTTTFTPLMTVPQGRQFRMPFFSGDAHHVIVPIANASGAWEITKVPSHGGDPSVITTVPSNYLIIDSTAQ